MLNETYNFSLKIVNIEINQNKSFALPHQFPFERWKILTFERRRTFKRQQHRHFLRPLILLTLRDMNTKSIYIEREKKTRINCRNDPDSMSRDYFIKYSSSPEARQCRVK